MLNNTTFIFASLNNGYDNNKQDPVENYHFERTIFSVNTLKKSYDVNIVFVDWCSEEKNKYQKHLAPGIKYVYVPPLVNDYLHLNNDSTQQFYEFIGKDIGSELAETNKIVMANGDNIFPKKFMQKVCEIESSSPEYWYVGKRLNIENSVFKDKEKLLFDADNNPEVFKVVDVCVFCNGDFTFIDKNTYNKAQGYAYSHWHAHEDSCLTARLEKIRAIGITWHDEVYYHLQHRACGSIRQFSTSPIDKESTKQFIMQNVQICTT